MNNFRDHVERIRSNRMAPPFVKVEPVISYEQAPVPRELVCVCPDGSKCLDCAACVHCARYG